MDDLIFKYPHTDLHSVNLDYILKIVRENAGLHLEISGNQLILKTADNTIISAVTIPYATEAGSASTANSAAYASSAGSAASATYAASAGSATTATNATNATHASTADSATSATSATNATNADHAAAADIATLAIKADSATSADYAETTGSVEHAEKAIETVSLNGNYFRFFTHDGTAYEIAAPYAVKASRDASANYITQTYFADVIDDSGVLKFKNAQGDVIKSLTPSIAQAQTDSYGNTIADYVKDISVSSNSDYVTVDHGTGTADTLTIHYSETAWKDTNGNVIKNTYIKRLEIVTDPNDGHKKLVAYNGDNPEAELFRIPVEAYSAQVAAESSHSQYSDYATSAGTAATSTGSISSITTPSDMKQYIVINNGDGTTKNINLFYGSHIKAEMYETLGQISLFDSSFTVGHSEEYEIDSSCFTKYGFTEALDFMEEGTFINLMSEGHEELINVPLMGNKNTNGFYNIIVFNDSATTLEMFNVKPGQTDTSLKFTRIL